MEEYIVFPKQFKLSKDEEAEIANRSVAGSGSGGCALTTVFIFSFACISLGGWLILSWYNGKFHVFALAIALPMIITGLFLLKLPFKLLESSYSAMDRAILEEGRRKGEKEAAILTQQAREIYEFSQSIERNISEKLMRANNYYNMQRMNIPLMHSRPSGTP